MLRDIKMRKLFSWGLFIEGACCFSYEFLKPFQRSFLTGSIRAIQGIGASLVFPGYFFIVCVQFSREIPTLIPKIGAVFSLGMVLWLFCSGFLIGARVLMFPFICVRMPAHYLLVLGTVHDSSIPAETRWIQSRDWELPRRRKCSPGLGG
ncbi:hypothetical protein MRX96_055976 [Rhipicephalus microplus]